MGLDQYAEAVDEDGNVEEIAYWRKHPNLQGWMEELWLNKENPEVKEFNCVSVELNLDDLSELEVAVRNQELPETSGFFFGNNSDAYYKDEDLEFIQKAKQVIKEGRSVRYRSSW